MRDGRTEERAAVEGQGVTVAVSVWLARAHEALVARGVFEPLFQAYLDHASQWQALPHPAALPLMRPALAAATLHLACRPPDLSTAWTINLREPDTNLFITGDNADWRVTGRAYTEDVATGPTNRIFLETQRPRQEPTRSVVSVEGREVLALFEQFFTRSDQIPTRLLPLGDELVMVQGMPRLDREWFDALAGPQAAQLLERTELEHVERRSYRFACGCNAERIRHVVHGLFRDDAAALFAGEERIEVFCPRCGRRYWLSQREFRDLDN